MTKAIIKQKLKTVIGFDDSISETVMLEEFLIHVVDFFPNNDLEEFIELLEEKKVGYFDDDVLELED